MTAAEKLTRMRACAPLLPGPGDRVILPLIKALEDVLALVTDGGDYHYSVVDSADGEYMQEGQPCVPVDDLLHAIETALAEV